MSARSKRVTMVMGGLALVGGVVVAVAIAVGGDQISATLTGYQEVPAVSSGGQATFTASVSGDESSVNWTLSYSDLSSAIQQAHIHLGQMGVNGGIAVFLCTNLGNGPAGTQTCPAAPATINGTFVGADIVGPAGQGLAPGEMAELIDAVDAGATYANVHSATFPGGEVRAQLKPPPGPPGPKGATGPAGPQGAQGATGPTGKVKCKVTSPKKVKCKVKK